MSDYMYKNVELSPLWNEILMLIEKWSKDGNEEAKYYFELLFSVQTDTANVLNQIFNWLSNLAENDNIEAQYYVGRCYLNGDEVAVDYGKGEKYIKQAATNGLSEACYMLATIYEFGQGDITPDYDDSVKWYKMASKLHNESASHALKRLGEDDE